MHGPLNVKIQAGALQSSLDVTDHPETTLKPKHGLSPSKVESVHSYAE